MLSNNLVSLIANSLLYGFNYIYNHDNTLMRVVTDHKLTFDVLMIGASGAIG